MKIQVLVFMSEIIFELTLENKFSVSFMLLFVIIKLLLVFDSHVRKQTFFLAISRQVDLV